MTAERPSKFALMRVGRRRLVQAFDRRVEREHDEQLLAEARAAGWDQDSQAPTADGIAPPGNHRPRPRWLPRRLLRVADWA